MWAGILALTILAALPSVSDLDDTYYDYVPDLPIVEMLFIDFHDLRDHRHAEALQLILATHGRLNPEEANSFVHILPANLVENCLIVSIAVQMHIQKESESRPGGQISSFKAGRRAFPVRPIVNENLLKANVLTERLAIITCVDSARLDALLAASATPLLRPAWARGTQWYAIMSGKASADSQQLYLVRILPDTLIIAETRALTEASVRCALGLSTGFPDVVEFKGFKQELPTTASAWRYYNPQATEEFALSALETIPEYVGAPELADMRRSINNHSGGFNLEYLDLYRDLVFTMIRSFANEDEAMAYLAAQRTASSRSMLPPAGKGVSRELDRAGQKLMDLRDATTVRTRDGRMVRESLTITSDYLEQLRTTIGHSTQKQS